MDKDDSGTIDVNEFMDYFFNRAKCTLDMKKMVAATGMLGIKKANLMDRILLGIQQIDVDAIEEEEK